MAKQLYVKDIKTGDRISEFFLVKEKILAYSQKGAPYLNLKLGDMSGQVEAKVWDNATECEALFKKGDIIQIKARAQSYKNTLQLSIVEIRTPLPEEIDPADYLPTAREDANVMLAELMKYVEGIVNPHLLALLKSFFDDEEIRNRFKAAPAAKGFHHVYLGGLLEHTLSVVRLLDLVTRHYQGLNRDLIIAGGILHDLGKIYEFNYDRLIEYSDEGRLVGHIVMGAEMIGKRIEQLPSFPASLAMELKHLILSHHGMLEYGSPKLPNTVEAMVVHMVDDLDAKVNAFQEYIKASPADDSNWTPFHRLFDRYIYKGSAGQG